MTTASIIAPLLIIHEPTTVFSDVLISIICFLCIKKLRQNTYSNKFWILFFLFFAFSTLTGAVSHGFFEVHSGTTYKIFWLGMQVLNTFAVFFAQLATFESILSARNVKPAFRNIYYVQLLITLISIFVFQNFLVVVINNAVGLIPVMIQHFIFRRSKADVLIGAGILVSFATAAIHILKIRLHANFNDNDLSHVFIMISLFLMYKGALSGAKLFRE